MKKDGRKAVSFILTLAMVITMFAAMPLTASAYGALTTAYLSKNGSDSNDGATKASAVRTFAAAKSLIAEGGKIDISTTYAIDAGDSQEWSLSDNPAATVVRDLSATVSFKINGTLTLSGISFVNPSSASSSTRFVIQTSTPGAVLTLNPGTSMSASGAATNVRVDYGTLNIGSEVSLSGGSLGNISISSLGKIKITDNLTNEITVGLVTALRSEGTVIGTVANGITDISKLVYYQLASTEKWYLNLSGSSIVVTATEPDTPIYSITASAVTTGGSISPAGIASVPKGSSQSYTITPVEDYNISDVKVDGTSVLSDSAYSVTNGVGSYTFSNVATDHAITAEFKKNTLTVSTKTVDFYVGMDCRSDTFPQGRTITITNSSDTAITLTEPEDTTYFAIGLSDTTVPAGGSVTMTVTPSAAEFIAGGTSHLRSDYTTFTGSSTSNSVTDPVTITTSDGKNSVSVTASFHVMKSKTVTVVGAEHGTVNVSLSNACYVDQYGEMTSSNGTTRDLSSGEEVTILAGIDGLGSDYSSAGFTYIPDAGYNRGILTVYSSCTDGSITSKAIAANEFHYIGPLSGNHERFVATFVKQTFDIASSVTASGGIISAGGSVEYATDRVFTITPDRGYHINKVYVDNEATDAAISAATGVGTYTFANVTAGHTIEASFAPNIYTVAFDKNSADATGTMESQTGFVYSISKDVSPCAFILDGKKFIGWSTAKDSGVASYQDNASINIATVLDNETVTLYAVWANNAYTITSSRSTQGGRISDGGLVGYGTDAEFTITPEAGYHIYEIRVDTDLIDIEINSATGVGKYKFSNVTQDHTIDACFAANHYDIAFDKNSSDTTGTMEKQTGLTYGTAATLKPCEFSRSGYTFAGWSASSTVTAAAYSDEGSANIATTLDGETVTLYAVWSLKSNSDSGSGGGGGTVSEKSGTELVKDSSGAQKAVAATNTSAKIDTSGKAAASVDKSTLGSALEQAVKAAGDADEKAGSASGTTGVEVVVEVSAGAGARSIETSLPVDTLKEMAQQSNTQLTVNTPLVDITLDQEALAAITDQAGDKVALSVEKLDNTSLPETAQAVVGDAPVYDLKVLGEFGTIADFKGGTATVSIPYTLKEGENAAQVTVYYINSAGDLTKMNCTYDPVTKMATFETGHFSYYAVMIASGAARFTDVSATAWYYKAAAYVIETGLFNGTSETTFSPNADMTRAMFITALGRASGVNTADYEATSFSDVASGSWYEGYIEWAYENKIISGTGGDKFAPNQAITREQMASILNNYCIWKNENTNTTEVQLGYADADRISGWAEAGVRLCTENKWLTGYPDGSFMPQKTATRAEVAAIFQRYAQTL